MSPHKRSGSLITFEGPEGSGKSTHARRLAAWLRGQGFDVLLTREPGGTALGNQLRKIFLSSKRKKMDPMVELCLVEASRAVLVSEVLEPALKRGQVVLLDRFQDSTWVYQGYAGGLDSKFVEAVGKVATGGLVPRLTLLMDVPAREGLRRAKRPNRMEAKPLAFHQKVRSGYLALARRQKKRIRLIRVDRPVDQVQAQIREVVGRALR